MTIAPTTSAYEVAVDFIRLGNILRLWESLGWTPSAAFLQEMSECRYHLDHVLTSTHDWSTWDNTAWDKVVRKRLIEVPPPTVAGF